MTENSLQEMDIKDVLTKISERGYIKSLRKNNTGIGYTLETIMGIKENNSGEADFAYNGIPVELKAQRKHASSNITLITKSPHWEPLSAKEIIEKYGYKDAKGRKGLKVTLKATEFNPQELKLETTDGNINIMHRKDGVICYFIIDELMDKIDTKLFENLLLVFAETKKEHGIEFFHYNEAVLLRKLSASGFKQLINEGLMVWEFRMHIKCSGSVRDHGAGFRLNRRQIDKLYEKKERML